MRWVAYGDGWERTSEDCEPSGVPAFGLLGIAQVSDAVGYELLHGRSYFIWTDRYGWDNHDRDGLIERLAHFPGCIVRFGRSVPTNRYRDLLIQRAANDDRLPRKSGTEKRELPAGEMTD